MSWLGQLMVDTNNWRNGTWKIKQSIEVSSSPLRLGVLGAAAINYTAIIDPIQSHPDVVLAGIAARDKARAEAQIAKYPQTNLSKRPPPKAYGSYEELVSDPNIDAVYIPLPNGLHCKWAIKSLESGKHVLIEKPIANNASEAHQIAEAAKKAGKVALEAYHWRFHPAAHRVKAVIDSGRYGSVTGVDSKMTLFRGALANDDIRFQYELGGGSIMDFCYVVSACLYFAGKRDDIRVLEAKPRLHNTDKNIDEAMDATFVLDPPAGVVKPPVTCHISADAAVPHFFGFIPRIWDVVVSVSIELQKARIDFSSFVIPTFGHGIVIHEKGADGKLTGEKTTETRYVAEENEQWPQSVGEKWWTTYRWQLEAFVETIRAKERGKKWEGPWVDLGESASVLHAIDSVYEKAGLPKRGL